jgi:hypothetical protein
VLVKREINLLNFLFKIVDALKRTNSIQVDPNSPSPCSGIENPLNTLTPTIGQPTPVHVKKISRILYEIGSILSFVGIGKDYKQNQITSMNASSNPAQIPAESQTTRRSPNKKQTPSSFSHTSGTTSIHNPSSNLLTPSSLAPTLLSPCKTNSHSHSLTRLQRTYPHRFKSLSSHSHKTIDDTNNSSVINNEFKIESNVKDVINITTSNNSLSPNMNTSNYLRSFSLNIFSGKIILLIELLKRYLRLK